MRMNAEEMSVSEFDELSLELKIGRLMKWITDTNDVCFGRSSKSRVRKVVKWWRNELECMKKEVRKRRKMYQKARKSGKDGVRNAYAKYSEYVRRYKRRIMELKESNWREFVSEEGDKDPWGGGI